MTFRNFFLSDLYKSFSEFEIIVITLDKCDYIQEFLKERNIKFYSIKLNVVQKMILKYSIQWIERGQYYHFYFKHQTKTMEKYIQRDKEESLLKYWFSQLFCLIFGSIFKRSNIVKMVYTSLLSKKLKNIVSTSESVFLCSHDVIYDKALMCYADYKHVKSTVLVHSWDNLPSRGYLCVKPTQILVWSEIMKIEGAKLHQFDHDSIKVIGVPQFYYYKQIEKRIHQITLKPNLNLNTQMPQLSLLLGERLVVIQMNNYWLKKIYTFCKQKPI